MMAAIGEELGTGEVDWLVCRKMISGYPQKVSLLSASTHQEST
jgi:hypothetical protein